MAETTPAPPSTAASAHIIPTTAILTTPRVYIRPYEFTTSDMEAMADAANAPGAATYMRSRFPSPYTVESARWWLEHCRTCEEPRPLSFGVFTVATGEYVGNIGLEQPADPVYAKGREIAYYGNVKFRGTGLMSEGVRALTRWAFATIPDLTRIEAAVFDQNVASIRVLAKVGFVKEGSRRLAVFKHGQQMSEEIYGLIRTDIEE